MTQKYLHLIIILAIILESCAELCEVENSAYCNLIGNSLVDGKFGSENYCLCLEYKELATSTILSPNSFLLLEPEIDYKSKQHSISNITMAYGYPIKNGVPQNASAEGYIGDDNNFYGVLHFNPQGPIYILENRTLFADPYNKHDPSRDFGAFESMDILERYRREQGDQINQHVIFPFNIDHKLENTSGVARARICELLLMADKEFFDKDSNSSLNHAVRRMVHSIAQADIIFRNSDFDEDGVPDNIGFSIKYILVLTSQETSDRLFGDLLTTRIVDGRNYLLKFARLRRLSEVCLGVAFSGHSFHNRTLGLSFTSLGGGIGGAAGGLCDRRAYGRSFNTLVIAHSTSDSNDRVSERLSGLTLAHEIGHSFGAHHDDNFPNSECRGYLMSSQSTTVNNPYQFEFSICSRRLIAATLASMSYCLVDQEKPYCGNGIVESGEACDCGLPSRCHLLDPCCTPRAGGALVYEDGTVHKDGCTVAPGAVCHPSQGMCCNPDCKYADLSNEGIFCSESANECDDDCLDTENTDCQCGLGGRCLKDKRCLAAECVRLGLIECECPISGPGGSIGEAHKCGVCCYVHTNEDEEDVRCVGAESAAKLHHPAVRLPVDWPDPTYTGPNVTTILCDDNNCTQVVMRAWHIGGACVSMNVAGICSGRGQCKATLRTPRSNVYPVGLTGRRLSSNADRSHIGSIILMTILMTIDKTFFK